MHAIKFALVVSLVAASCSSSSGGLKTDSGSDTMAVGTGGSGGGGGSGCTPAGVSGATIDAGTLWGCFEQACASQLAACAAECLCNNAVVDALGCRASGGTTTTCFTPVFSAGTNGPAVVTCLVTSMSACGLAPADGGGDAAAGDGSAAEGGASDAGDAGASQ